MPQPYFIGKKKRLAWVKLEGKKKKKSETASWKLSTGYNRDI